MTRFAITSQNRNTAEFPSRDRYMNPAEGSFMAGWSYLSRDRAWRDAVRDYDRARVRKTRVYVWVDQESIGENLVNRRSRPYDEWRPVVAEALRAQGITEFKLNWNQRAGCSCPCSPGFIVTAPGAVGWDLHLTVVALPDVEPQGGKRSARSSAGNLRNFRAMGTDKLDRLMDAVLTEANDREAEDAIRAELTRRQSTAYAVA